MRRFERYNLPGLLDEFAATLCSECDLRNEARVADRFAFDFRDDPLMVVPRVVWPRTEPPRAHYGVHRGMAPVGARRSR